IDVAKPSGGKTTASPLDDPGATGADVLILQLGADQANLALAVPTDAAAPASAVGVVKFGVWPYEPPTATPDPASRPTPSPLSIPPSPVQSGTGASLVVVPSLIGLPEAEAQRRIDEAGLMTTYVNYQMAGDVADQKYFLSIAPGHVLSQSPRPGTSVPRGARILLAVRKAQWA